MVVTDTASKMRSEHLRQLEEETKHLWDIREACKMHPVQQCIIEMNDMDQRQTRVPRFLKDSNLRNCEVINNRLIGVRVNEVLSMVSHLDHWRSKRNVTVSVLLQVVKKMQGQRATLLHLHVNYVASNQNDVLLFICCLLVHRHVFEAVKIT
jgi:hypothetical protein